MQVNIREIVAAHSHLGGLYRQVFPQLRDCLKARHALHLSHSEPKIVGAEPYDVAAGIADMLQAVKASQVLKVSGLHDSTLYERDGNAWFRTVHDMVHLLYELGFTPAAELRVHDELWSFITTAAGWHSLSGRQALIAEAVYWADTTAQTLYEKRTGKFPVDQGAFVIQQVKRRLHNAQA